MATLALSAAASALIPAQVAGATLIGSFTVGQAVGLGVSLVGGIIDRAFFAPDLPTVEGQKLSTDSLTSTFNGQQGTRVYETAAVTAHILWASRFEQVKTEEEVGGKGGPSQTQITYQYFVSISYVFAEEVDAVVQVFFDAKPRDLGDFNTTFYTGTGNTIDPTIEAVEGVGNVTPYHGLAHMVFDDLDLTTHFSNRPPTVRAVVRNSLSAATLPKLLEAIMADDGIAVDVSQVPAYLVQGAAFSGVTSPRSRFTSIAAPRLIDLVERSRGTFEAVPRYGAPVATFDWSELPVGQRGESPIQVKRDGPAKVPSRVHLSAPDPARDYEEVPAQVSADAGEVTQLRTPEALYEPQALALANGARMDAIVRRTKVAFTLPARAMLDPLIKHGAIIRLIDRDQSKYDVQIVGMSFQGALHCEGETVLSRDPYTEPGEGSPGFASRDPRDPVAPTVAMMDLPWTSGAKSDLGVYVAAYADPWYPMAVLREQQFSLGADHDAVAAMQRVATMGSTTSALAIGDAESWDASAQLDVTLLDGSFASKSQAQVEANNINAIAVQAADSSWEVMQFADAVLLSGTTWRLSNLYRGRGGETKAIPSGARVVALNGAVSPVEARVQDVSVQRVYKVGPAVKDVGDASYVTVNFTSSDRGRTPYLVTDIAATMSGANVLITWSRPEQPHTSDSFEVKLYDGATLKGTHTVSGANKFLYLEADQVTDWATARQSGDTLTIGVREANTLGNVGGEAKQEVTLA
ncbi:hypothetical protein NBRC116590_02640 [Pelagimonas sp. KU-00592-HH]|uniref:GTA baseplate fiber-binding domain-containing protein n=1 Tax=Pelagimonas sp. KU-00592-HH TaxID=3127651 RepID=UPI003101F2B8